MKAESNLRAQSSKEFESSKFKAESKKTKNEK